MQHIYKILNDRSREDSDMPEIKSKKVKSNHEWILTDLTLGSDLFLCLRAHLPRLELELEFDLLLLFFKVLLLATGDKCRISFSIGDQYDTESAAICNRLAHTTTHYFFIKL